MDLRSGGWGWEEDILVNKLAFALKQRQLHEPTHFISAGDYKKKSHN
jgi:hypothetical protein